MGLSVDITISRALRLALFSQWSISSDFREETKPLHKSPCWVPLIACSNVDRHGEVHWYSHMDITE